MNLAAALSRFVSLEDLRDRAIAATFQTASYLTDPICKSHEFYRRCCVVDALDTEENELVKLARKAVLGIGIIGCALGAVFTTLPGVALRGLGSYLQNTPFIEFHQNGKEKILPEGRSFSLLSWNICCVAGGYTISDGGVEPWAFRIDAIAREILTKNADVNCIYETFDANSAFYLANRLRENGYRDVYFYMGPRAIGVCSGIMVASRYTIENPEFSPFPSDSLVGRTRYAEKGVFGFDLKSGGEKFARIYATHLQHSEEPEFPTEEEVEARSRQMEHIMKKVERVQDRCVIVAGDLNLDDAEYRASSWQDRFQKGGGFTGKTWRGDAFCASMVGKRVSGPLNLDHVLVLKGTAKSISTTLVETGYDPMTYRAGALSDHEGLLSTIALK